VTGDEESRQALVEKTADKHVREWWQRFDPMTRAALSDAGYTEKGRRYDEEDVAADWAFDVRRLIGLSLLASRAQGDLLDEQWEGWPLLSDSDATMLADTVLYTPRLHTPELIGFALRFVVITQAARATSTEAMFGPARRAKVSIPRAVTSGVLAFGLVLAFPAAVGALLTFAAQGQLGWAIAAASVVGVGAAVLHEVLTRDSPRRASRAEHWTGLLWRPHSDSTGAGLRARLEEMIRNGVAVPPVAIDLCHALQAAHDRRAQAAFEMAAKQS